MLRSRNLTVCLLTAGLLLIGCGGDEASDPRRDAVSDEVEARWGKPLDELPVVRLVAISPHNQDIEQEFEAAFNLHHALARGERVEIEWRDVGGGSSAILEYLRNVYSRSDTAGIDIVWGGGDAMFRTLAEEGILRPMDLPAEALEQIPETFGGLRMYGPEHRWIGTVVSGFGLLYNRPMLDRLGVEPPETWDDLAGPEYYKLVALADPTQSGSAAATYEMIVQSGEDWPDGWAKLLAILSNANKFYDGASGAANAPVVGEAPIAACIDFYGAIRVNRMPDELVYVSPPGQTAFSPDPIGILKSPPHGELARRFVDFVLSRRGQALWALRVGAEDGPVHEPLGRQPIRKDVYTHYADDLSPWVTNPYAGGNEMQLDLEMREVRFGVLRVLVRTAAIDNREGLQAARKALIDAGFPPEKVETFNRLPANVRTREQIAGLAVELKDPTASERITTGWQRFFRDKYAKITE